MKYTAKYFKEDMPEWKRRKDPILSRFFYRRVSFVGASICANYGINANTVSYISAFIAIVSCSLFLLHSNIMNILGAVLINVWLIMDCTDGNLARSYRRQPFGEFADGISSYILVGLMSICMGVSVYHSGGIIFEKGNAWIVFFGALGSEADTLMRLVYQKYKATAAEMVSEGIIKPEEDKRTDHSQVRSLRVRVEAELGIGGILPIAILIASIFNALDLIVVYCFLYYGASALVAILLYVHKAIRHTKEYENNQK